MQEQSTCRSCGAAIVWRTHAHTARRAPLDAAPSAQGNCRLLPDGATYEVVSRGEVGAPGLHTNHFTTCPNAAQWSRRASAKEST
jgi:hypothetical protein